MTDARARAGSVGTQAIIGGTQNQRIDLSHAWADARDDVTRAEVDALPADRRRKFAARAAQFLFVGGRANVIWPADKAPIVLEAVAMRPGDGSYFRVQRYIAAGETPAALPGRGVLVGQGVAIPNNPVATAGNPVRARTLGTVQAGTADVELVVDIDGTPTAVSFRVVRDRIPEGATGPGGGPIVFEEGPVDVVGPYPGVMLGQDPLDSVDWAGLSAQATTRKGGRAK